MERAAFRGSAPFNSRDGTTDILDTTHFDHIVALSRHVLFSRARARLDLNREALQSVSPCEAHRAVDDSLKFWFLYSGAGTVMIWLSL
jgi:hypothetical protein